MNPTEFETIRDIPGKRIKRDVRFSKRKSHLLALTLDNVPIGNDAVADRRLNITYNPETGSKTFNVQVSGVGPICRLDIDGPEHKHVGRSHKHALHTERCPDRNLPREVQGRSDLDGMSMRDLFGEFCTLADIEHEGSFEAPDET